MHPTMDHLGDMGHGLLLKFVSSQNSEPSWLINWDRFMSTPVGFRFLYDAGYIYREMEDWFNVGLTLAIRSLRFWMTLSIEIQTTSLRSKFFCPGCSTLQTKQVKMKTCCQFNVLKPLSMDWMNFDF
jgi:hypothetical protein